MQPKMYSPDSFVVLSEGLTNVEMEISGSVRYL